MENTALDIKTETVVFLRKDLVFLEITTNFKNWHN
jgi:hypothetical protein